MTKIIILRPYAGLPLDSVLNQQNQDHVPHPISLGFYLITIILPTPVSSNCFLPFSL